MWCNYYVEQPIKNLGIKSSVVCEIYGINIPPHANGLVILKAQILQEILAIDDIDIDSDKVLNSYRMLVSSIGRSSKKFPPAAGNLIENIRRSGCFPSINTVVDSYNITACRYKVAIGAHDLDLIGRDICFRLSLGGEPFLAVGSNSIKKTAANDYVYADENRILAWLDSKDSNDVKITSNTKNVLLVIQGTDLTTLDYNRSAIEDAATRIVTYCGGSFQIKVV